MAKKVVASLQKKDNRKYVRCIKMTEEGRNGAYLFKEEMVANENIKDFFAN